MKNICLKTHHIFLCILLIYPISFGQDTARTKILNVYNTLNNPYILPKDEAGDPMPVYMDGEWHLYTLSGNLSVMHHFTSIDLINWKEHTPAMTGGDIATGTILKHDGKYYCFFTLASKQRLQLIISDNPWFFYRNAENIVENNFQVPKWDYLSFYPPGRPVEPYQGWPYTIAEIQELYRTAEVR